MTVIEEHPIVTEQPHIDDGGCWHRIECGCGSVIDGGPFSWATQAEQEAFRLYAAHVGPLGRARPGPADVPFSPAPSRTIWTIGSRQREST